MSTSQEAWFRKLEIQKPEPPTEAEIWFISKAEEALIPLQPLYRPGPKAFYTVLEFRNGRTQKVYVEFPWEKAFGHSKISIYSVAWIGSNLPDSSKVFDILSKGSGIPGGWRFTRVPESDNFQLTFQMDVLLPSKPDIADFQRTIIEIGTMADSAEAELGFADVDNH